MRKRLNCMCVVFHLNGWYQNTEPKKEEEALQWKQFVYLLKVGKSTVVPKKSESLMNCT